MRIAIDIDTGEVKAWSGQAITTAFIIKRRDRFPVEVRFTQDGLVVERPLSATGMLGLRAAGDFAGDLVAAATSWVVSGYGATSVYTFDLNLNTEELESLFEDEPASVTLNAEVVCMAGDFVQSSATFALTVANDIVRGDEALPGSLAIQDKLLIRNASTGTVYELTVDPNGILTTEPHT